MDDFKLLLCDIQGRLFENSTEFASESFIKSFMNSEVALHLDSKYNKLQWMGEEYLLEELTDEVEISRDGERFDKEVLYWTGYIYRYWACLYEEKSKKIYRYAPAKTMKRNYMVFHTMDPRLAIEDLLEIYSQKHVKKGRAGE